MATFTFTSGTNAFTGGSDADLFIVPSGMLTSVDSFSGGAGFDTLRFDFAAKTFALNNASWMAGIDRVLVNTADGIGLFFGALIGRPDRGALVITGGSGADTIDTTGAVAGYAVDVSGGGGNDYLVVGAEAGHNIFRPGLGNDTFLGGAGNDLVEFYIDPDPLLTHLGAGDVAVGGSGSSDVDTLRFYGPGSLALGLVAFGGAFELRRFEVIDASALAGGISLTYETSTALFTGSAVTLIGGAGNDSMTGTAFRDTFRPGSGGDGFNGGGGNDLVEIAPSEVSFADILVGGADVDTLRFTASGVLAPLVGGQIIGFEAVEIGPGGLSVVFQSAISGPDGPLPVFGGSGADRLDARMLDRSIRLTGAEGADTLFGSPFGAPNSGAPGDTLDGGAGNDRLFGDIGNDLLLGGADNDTLLGGAGWDDMSGGPGSDRLSGGPGNDAMSLGDEAGADTLLGDEDDDRVAVTSAGLDASDWIAGGRGMFDILTYTPSTAGAVVSAAIADRISGFEILLLVNTVSLTFTVTDLMAETAETPLRVLQDGWAAGITLDASAVTDSGMRVELDANRVFGKGAAHTVIGGGGMDTVVAGTGDATIRLGGGDDLLLGLDLRALPTGAAFDGGAGVDTVRVTGPTSIADTRLARFAGFEVVHLADATNDLLLTDAGLPAGSIGFTVVGGDETDLLDAAAVTSALRLFGGGGSDEIAGGSGADYLSGGRGADVLVAGAGNDTVRFDDAGGDDAADGGTGVDLLSLNLAGIRAPASFFAPFTGFEALQLELAGGRAVLPASIATGSSFSIELVSAVGGAAGVLNAAQMLVRLDIGGSVSADNIVGGRNADTIRDGSGADRIQGFLGADQISLVGDGAADRIVYVNVNDGARDIAVATGPGTLAQADTITGFAGVGDPDNLLELVRSGFAGIGAKTAVQLVAAGGAVDLSTGAVFLLDAADAVAGFATRAAIDAAFASRVQAGDAGQGAFVVARGAGGTDAALYYLRDADGLAGIADADLMVLLAVLVAPGAITASEIVLV